MSLFGAVDMFVRSMAGNRPDLIYAATDAHGALAIGTGCALAAWWPLSDTALESPIGRTARWLLVPSLAFLAVVLTSVDYRSTFMFRGGSALAAAGIAILLVNALAGRACLAPLRLAPLVWLGRLSYGMYLWHLAIYSLVGYLFWRVHAPTYLVRITWLVALAATVATAAASYYAVERPMRRRLSPRPILTEDVSATTPDRVTTGLEPSGR